MRRFRRAVPRISVIGIVAALALLTAASVSAATPSSISHMSVHPIISPAGNIDPAYGLFTCQLGPPFANPPGSACYDPYQMRNAYGVAPLIAAGNDGTGKTIIIVDAFNDPALVSDLSFFDSFYGLPAANLTVIHPCQPAPNYSTCTGAGPTPPFDNGWAGETTLDVEWSHAIAPGAKILLVEGQDNSDPALQSALQYAVGNNMGDVISQSFGENDTCLDSATMQAWHSTYVDATRKGMTIFASSGDEGAAQQTCDGKIVGQGHVVAGFRSARHGRRRHGAQRGEVLPGRGRLRSGQQSDLRHVSERDRLERRAAVRRLPGVLRLDHRERRRLQHGLERAVVSAGHDSRRQAARRARRVV